MGVSESSSQMFKPHPTRQADILIPDRAGSRHFGLLELWYDPKPAERCPSCGHEPKEESGEILIRWEGGYQAIYGRAATVLWDFWQDIFHRARRA